MFTSDHERHPENSELAGGYVKTALADIDKPEWEFTDFVLQMQSQGIIHPEHDTVVDAEPTMDDGVQAMDLILDTDTSGVIFVVRVHTDGRVETAEMEESAPDFPDGTDVAEMENELLTNIGVIYEHWATLDTLRVPMSMSSRNPEQRARLQAARAARDLIRATVTATRGIHLDDYSDEELDPGMFAQIFRTMPSVASALVTILNATA